MGRHTAVLTPEAAPPQQSFETPPILPQTVGAAAMGGLRMAHLAHDQADRLASGGHTAYAEYARQKANEAYQQTRHMLNETRTKLATSPNQQLAETYLQVFLKKEFAEAQAHGSMHRSIVSWVADKEHGATDEQLYGFLEGHVQRIAKEQQDPEFNRAVAEAKLTYIHGVEQAVHEQRYSPAALRSLSKVRDAHVLVGDIWDTRIMGIFGYYTQKGQYVVLGQDIGDKTREEMVETLVHELDHLQFPPNADDARWETEALAEYNTLVMLKGQPEVVAPADRPGDSHVYVAERKLVDLLLNEGRVPIEPKLVSRAHSSPVGSAERAALEKAYERSWGPGVRQWANDKIAIYEQNFIKRGLSEDTAQQAAVSEVYAELYTIAKRQKAARARGSFAQRVVGQHRAPSRGRHVGK